MPALQIVDAHHHFWDPTENYIPWLVDEPPIAFRYGDYRPIRKPYLPKDYLGDAAPHEVLATVYVETEWDPTDPLGELEWVHDVAKDTGFPNAVVGQAWLHHDDAPDILRQAARYPLVRSVRHKPAAASSADQAVRGAPASMDDPKWRDGYAVLGTLSMRFDLQTPWWHLDAAVALANDFPTIPLILNHTGLPSDRSEEGLAAWATAMASLAECPNAYVKISGIGQPDVAWTPASNGYVVRETLAMFGVERAMFASNFPVDGICASYRTIFEGFAEIVRDCDEATRHALFVSNALRIYDIAL
jgi:predicted TIM-barrel fold metal-dependent hydrolase